MPASNTARTARNLKRPQITLDMDKVAAFKLPSYSSIKLPSFTASSKFTPPPFLKLVVPGLSSCELICRKANSLRPLSRRSNSGFVEAVPLEMGDNWKRTALLVIDMQNDFIEDGSPMLVKGGKDIVPTVIKAVEVARQRGILVVWVVREHDPLGRDVELFRQHFYADGKVGPTTKGTAGAELVDGLEIKDGEYKVVKTRFSAFFATHLHSFLQRAGINSLVITGVQTPNCIRQTVYDAVALDYQPVTVIVDATAAATPEIHFANMFDMKNIGVATPTLQEWS